MSIKQCEDRLLDRGLRPTPARILTLRKLSELEYPVSLLELETMLDTLDKSTISVIGCTPETSCHSFI